MRRRVEGRTRLVCYFARRVFRLQRGHFDKFFQDCIELLRVLGGLLVCNMRLLEMGFGVRLRLFRINKPNLLEHEHDRFWLLGGKVELLVRSYVPFDTLAPDYNCLKQYWGWCSNCRDFGFDSVSIPLNWVIDDEPTGNKFLTYHEIVFQQVASH